MLLPGTRIGPYEVTGAIGAGAMGEVYRAHDLKLRRDVAIKVLPDAFALDRERLARFGREAQLLAAIDHPGIARIHGLEDTGGVQALVMELVGGPTLAERIADGPVPIDEALALASQLAGALEAAHERGIIHRDLKPANIKLTPAGTVKILDFGLAKALGDNSTGDPVSSPTITAIATRAGVVLGTAAYMSPEQARGRPVDKRTDIWAFGCVLYELLTGRRAFTGESVSDTLAAVLGRDPDLRLLPPALLTPIRRLLRRCLEKDPKRRLHDIADARIELEDAIAGRTDGAQPADAPESRTRRWRRLAIAGAGTSVALGAVAIVSNWPGTQTPDTAWATANIAATQLTNYGGTETAAAIAPGGRTFVFVSAHGGTPDIWLRQVSGGEPVRLTADVAVESDLVYSADGESIYFTRREGSDRSIWRISALGSSPQRVVSAAHTPAPSADGRALAYYAADQDGATALVFRDLVGGGPRTLARSVTGVSPPAWSPDGRWVSYLQEGLWAPKNLFVVDAATGEARQATQYTKADEGITSHAWLPDNRHLAVTFAAGSPEQQDLGILDVQTGSLSRLTFNVGLAFQRVSLAADGSRLLVTSFVHRHGLWKVPLGPDPDENGRRAVRVIEDRHDPSWIWVSRDGRTLLFAGKSTGARNAWTMALEGPGTPRQVTAIADHGVYHPSLSPDGTQVAFASAMSGSSEIWLQNVDGSGLRQLTSDVYPDAWPVWSFDGRAIMFQSLHGGRYETWQIATDGGPAEKLWDGFFRGDLIPRPDGGGTWLVTWFGRAIRLYDLERRTVVWEQSIAGDGNPEFSPDGKLISIEAREGRSRSSIWIFEAATGQRRLGVRLPEGFFAEFRACWVDGGKALLLTRVEETSHVVLFDRFWVSKASSQ